MTAPTFHRLSATTASLHVAPGAVTVILCKSEHVRHGIAGVRWECPLWANSEHALADCRQVIDDLEARTMAVWDEARTMPGLRVPGTHFCAAATTSCD